MNKFYYFEGRIYETEEDVIKAAKNYANKNYDEITTEKTYDVFWEDFYRLKKQGESDYDAIESAR